MGKRSFDEHVIRCAECGEEMVAKIKLDENRLCTRCLHRIWRQEHKPRKNSNKEIEKIVKKSREAGMTYGEYVQKHGL